MRRLVVLLALSALVPQAALAHAMLLKCSPAVGSTATAGLTQLEMHFSEGVEPSFTTVDVTDGSGAHLETAGLHTATGDATTLFVPVKPLPPGTYAVVWHATSVDTHKTQGHFSFTVAP